MNNCACGCGGEVKRGKRFIHGHNGKHGQTFTPEERERRRQVMLTRNPNAKGFIPKPPVEPKPCECGCGERVITRFKLGHHVRVGIGLNSENRTAGGRLGGKARWEIPQPFLDESKLKMSITRKRLIAEGVIAVDQIARPSKPQLRLWGIVHAHFPDAELELKVVTPVGSRFIDVAVVSEKLAFEYDEPYWHPDPAMEAPRDALPAEQGWVVIHIRNPKFDASEVWKLAVAALKAQRP